MASCLLRVIAFLYLATTGSQGFIHPIGGAIAAATAGKVFFTGAIAAAAGAIAVGAFHKALEDFWNQHIGQNTQMPKAIKDCMNNGNGNMETRLKVDFASYIRFKSYLDPTTTAEVIINVTGSMDFTPRKSGGGSLGPTNALATLAAAPMGAPAAKAAEKAAVVSIEDSLATLFFKKDDLSLGKKMLIHFTKSTNTAPFLPRDLVDKIPFTLNNYDNVIKEFNYTTDSPEAGIMKDTLKFCERSKGDRKCCNSLETMVEYAKSIVGGSVKAISTNVDKETKMLYKVKGLRKLPCGSNAVTCHKVPFPSAMFDCQKEEKITVYVANLLGSDGSAMNAPCLCYEDTGSWDPNHWVFKVVNAKPGSGRPICQFLLDDDVLWIPK